MRAIEIHFYGHDAPIALPMPEATVAAAQACFERVRSDVIEAQRHNGTTIGGWRSDRSGRRETRWFSIRA